MTCKVTGYTDFTAQQSVMGYPSDEANLTHDIDGVGDCGGTVLMGQGLWNQIQQDIKDSILRTPYSNPRSEYIRAYLEPRRNDYISRLLVPEVYPPHFRTGLEICIKKVFDNPKLSHSKRNHQIERCILGELPDTDKIKASLDDFFNMAAREK